MRTGFVDALRGGRKGCRALQISAGDRHRHCRRATTARLGDVEAVQGADAGNALPLLQTHAWRRRLSRARCKAFYLDVCFSPRHFLSVSRWARALQAANFSP